MFCSMFLCLFIDVCFCWIGFNDMFTHNVNISDFCAVPDFVKQPCDCNDMASCTVSIIVYVRMYDIYRGNPF